MRNYTAILLLLLTSCSISKKLPEGQKVYSGAEVKINRAYTNVSYTEAKDLEELLSNNTFPRKNTLVFGFPLKVWFHYVIGEPKKKKGIRNFLQDKIGEKPVFFSPGNIELNEKNLENIAENEGYFKTKVQGTGKSKKITESVLYEANVQNRYYLNDIAYDTIQFRISDNPEALFSRSLLKKDAPYSLQTIANERKRIADELQNQGYYLLDSDKIIVEVDTNLNNNGANLNIKLKTEYLNYITKKFKIQDVNIYTSYRGAGVQKDTLKTSLSNLQENGLQVFQSGRYYKSKVFEEAITVRAGDFYSRKSQEASYNRLSNLQNFKFIRNKFDIARDSSDNLLNVSYFLTPVERKTLKLQLNGYTKNNGLFGTELGAVWMNRNFFHAAEIFQLEFNVGRDLQFSSNGVKSNFTRYKIKSELIFPRFVLLFRGINQTEGGGIPKTSVSLSYEEQQQNNLYTQTSLNSGLKYYWRKNAEYEHTLSPIYVNLIKPRNITDQFVETVLNSDNPADLQRYFEILDSRLVIGIEYELNYMPAWAQDKNNTLNMNIGLDVAGNLASLLSGKNKVSENSSRTLFGVPFDQFGKITFETKYYRKFRSLTWASRVISGFGLPYGNSTIMPKFKQYFSGGSNSLRGFRARSVGPGIVSPDLANSFVFGNNITGDIKLEFNTELRYKFTEMLELAAFYDTGNIWFYSENSAFGEEGKFSNNFLKELAADVGLGLRLDFTYLVLRGDLAIPVRKPWLTEKPNVWNEISLGNKTWRQENLVFSLAIARPF